MIIRLNNELTLVVGLYEKAPVYKYKLKLFANISESKTDRW